MTITETIKILESLAQETRLKAFKSLVRSGTNGMSAGEISLKIGVPQNTMSFHLSHMEKSGLIKSKKQGRFIIYKANFKNVEKLIKYLLESCCFDSNNQCQIATSFMSVFDNSCCG